jgi:hypothetical protein
MSSSKLTVEERDDMVHMSDPHTNKAHSGRHFKTYFLILLVIIFSPLGNVLLSTGMKEVGPMTFHTASQFFGVFAQVFTSGAIWLGIASLFAYFISYMLVLSWAM